MSARADIGPECPACHGNPSLHDGSQCVGTVLQLLTDAQRRALGQLTSPIALDRMRVPIRTLRVLSRYGITQSERSSQLTVFGQRVAERWYATMAGTP